jgi:XTP/dITP diphosphohydrolase
MKVILATHNLDKYQEMSDALKNFGISILSLSDFPNIGKIIEDGSTLTENAIIKAKTVFDITGIPSISDDTGLMVDALNGEPGVYSARYASENATYSDNVNKLLLNLKNIPKNKRIAQFKTVMVYWDNNTELIVEGSVKGRITSSPKGVGGFGYDSVFYIPQQEKTFAEMTIKEKNKISHRGIALHNLKKALSSIVKNSQTQENA